VFKVLRALSKMNFLGGPPNMFRVLKLLPKLSHGAKKVTRGIFRVFTVCRGLHKLVTNSMIFLGGPPAMFRVFKLLPKLSHRAKSDTWKFQDAQDVQAVQAFTQSFLKGPSSARHVAG
jgi:hypothetical protein